MKIRYQIIISLLFIVSTACKKKDVQPITSVEGKWKLASVSGCFSGQGAPVTKKQELIFKGNQYQLFIDDATVKSDTFHFEQVSTTTGKEWQLKMGGDYSTLYVTFTGNSMFLENRDPDTCSGTYIKED